MQVLLILAKKELNERGDLGGYKLLWKWVRYRVAQETLFKYNIEYVCPYTSFLLRQINCRQELRFFVSL